MNPKGQVVANSNSFDGSLGADKYAKQFKEMGERMQNWSRQNGFDRATHGRTDQMNQHRIKSHEASRVSGATLLPAGPDADLRLIDSGLTASHSYGFTEIIPVHPTGIGFGVSGGVQVAVRGNEASLGVYLCFGPAVGAAASPGYSAGLAGAPPCGETVCVDDPSFQTLAIGGGVAVANTKSLDDRWISSQVSLGVGLGAASLVCFGASLHGVRILR